MRTRFIFRVVLSLCFILIFVCAGCSPANSLNNKINSTVKPYSFSSFKWEISQISNSVIHGLSNPKVSINDTQAVTDYFSNNDRDSSQSQKIQSIISLQIRDVLASLNIHNPYQRYLGVLTFDFPPVYFSLSKPPCVLIISPRDKIENIQSVMLLQDMTEAQMEAVENDADSLNVSALVTEIGGLAATFPAFVNSENCLKDVIDGACEEWLHQYLAFTPLGSLYVQDLLGINPDYDVVTINETVASLAADEIGSLVCQKYYPDYFQAQQEQSQNQGIPVFDFNAAMRNIRTNVDGMLASGQIDAAEQYMDEQRDYLQTKGYYIRKLNQAYFAFYGSYAEMPTSVNPIGQEVQSIRANAPSLVKFLEEVSGVTSKAALDKIR
jgi:hypothetical protein